MVYDRTCRGRALLPGLTHAWWSGGVLYRTMRRFDAWYGARTWEEALTWLGRVGERAPLAEIQFWGHGKWGLARVDREALDLSALTRDHRHHAALRKIREGMVTGGRGLWWFRTCETLGAVPGQTFAQAWSEFFDARVAGHTYIIGPWQSGLHSLAPGEAPTWSADEGLAPGEDPAAPRQALWSRRRHPNTIHCLNNVIPSGY
ncbi:MAG: hypothetical protein H6713_00395 [Myxococcales bacterium]|nr:hypothetical protein [Myxococcales bacterium]